MHTVYIHKNLKNEKYYVGCTSQNPSYRWNNGKGYQSQPKMWKDIQESNWNTDWVHGILGKFENKKDALNYEAFLIAMLDSVDNGYNTSAFDNYKYKRTEETKRRMSESQTGEKSYWYGKHHSEDTKNKISASLTGKHNSPQKSVLQFSKEGDFIAEYSSIHEAECKTGCNKGHICECCKGKLKTTGGYVWRYAS